MDNSRAMCRWRNPCPSAIAMKSKPRGELLAGPREAPGWITEEGKHGIASARGQRARIIGSAILVAADNGRSHPSSKTRVPELDLQGEDPARQTRSRGKVTIGIARKLKFKLSAVGSSVADAGGDDRLGCVLPRHIDAENPPTERERLKRLYRKLYLERLDNRRGRWHRRKQTAAS